MEGIFEFRKRVTETLEKIDSEVLSYDTEEFWMIRAPYEFLEYYAEKNRYFNMAIALPVARGLHNGTYRKTPIMRNGQPHRPPYLLHCLTVCKMLADLWLPISNEEKDILLAAALCHDTIEDCDFIKGGTEIYEDFFMDEQVYQVVKLVSKRKDFTLDEEKAFFHGIESNRLSLLIKLSDRGHNVTDLYNMSEKKIEEYIGETRTYFLPMCEYARAHYPELDIVTEIMQDQLICLTKTAETLADQHKKRKKKLMSELLILRGENGILREQCAKLRKEGINNAR